MSDFVNELEAKIASANSDEEVLRIFSDAGIQVTAEELNAEPQPESGELNESALDAVSGGSIFYIVKKLWNRYKSSAGSSGGNHYSGGGRHG